MCALESQGVLLSKKKVVYEKVRYVSRLFSKTNLWRPRLKVGRRREITKVSPHF